MPESTTSPRARKPDRPKKPYPDFPLTPHASGTWQKKIRGKIHYFGKWGRRVNGRLERVPGDGWEGGPRRVQGGGRRPHAGRTPRASANGLTVADLCNRFLTSKLRKREAGGIGRQTLADYKIVTDLLVAAFGARRLVDDLAADDFAVLRGRMVKQPGPVRLANSITRAKGVFKYGLDNGLVERAVRYGSEFDKPDRAALRRHRAGSALAERPKPADYEACGLVFLDEIGAAWIRPSATYRSDRVTKRVGELLRKLGLHREGVGFYTLRRVFRTVADGARDTPAVDLIMGHNDPSTAAHYRERIDDARLGAVTDHVRAWLWPGDGAK